MEQRNDVPYIVHEGIMARLERIIHRLWFAVVLLIVLLVGSNALWLLHESKYQGTSSYEVEQDTTGGNNNELVGVNLNGETKGKIRKD